MGKDELFSGSVHEFLDRLAAREPTPGGGSAAAAAGALSAALARMVAAYSVGKSSQGPDAALIQQAAEQFAQSDRMLRQLVDEDAAAYQAYTRARKSADGNETARSVALAVAVPLETAAVACAALRLLDDQKARMNPRLVSDLGGAAVLAEACVQAASFNVRINLREHPASDPRGEVREELTQLLEHARQARESVMTWVASHLNE